MKIKTVLLFCLYFFTVPSWAAPASEYWGVWDKSDEKSEKVIDHAVWSGLLAQYLQIQPEGSFFSYGKVSKQDRQRLKDYINSLTSLDPRTFNRDEQKAYWINLYNALTVDLILQHYPVKSITKIGPWYKFGPWG